MPVIAEHEPEIDPEFELVHADTLRFFPRLVTDLGGDPDALLRRAGIDPSIFSRWGSKLGYREMAGLLERAAVELDCPDFGMRLARFFASAVGEQREARAGGHWRERRNAQWPRRDSPRTGGRATPYVVVSQQLASSPVHRGHRAAVPRREALILEWDLGTPDEQNPPDPAYRN